MEECMSLRNDTIGQLMEIVDPQTKERRIVELIAIVKDTYFGRDRENPKIIIMFKKDDWKLI